MPTSDLSIASAPSTLSGLAFRLAAAAAHEGLEAGDVNALLADHGVSREDLPLRIRKLIGNARGLREGQKEDDVVLRRRRHVYAR